MLDLSGKNARMGVENAVRASGFVTAAFVVVVAVASFEVTTALLPLVETAKVVVVAAPAAPAAPAEQVPDKNDVPRVVRTIPIGPWGNDDPPAVASVVTLAVEVPPPIEHVAPPKLRSGDICAKHGGQRIDDPARRSWRCKFPKRAIR